MNQQEPVFFKIYKNTQTKKQSESKTKQKEKKNQSMRGEEHIGDNAAQIINAKAKKKTKN